MAMKSEPGRSWTCEGWLYMAKMGIVSRPELFGCSDHSVRSASKALIFVAARAGR